MATWAKGVDFKNSGNTARVGGVGIYGTDGTVQKAYLAVGTDPWNNKGLEVTTSAMTFMGNKVYHAGAKPTPSEIGAAASSHTHNYAGSSSAGGAANSAIKATQDSAGQQINTTYIKGLSISGKTITFTKGDGTTGTLTTQDTNTTYSVGTASALGLTKLYTGTGTATDGTMTQAAINSALGGKANSSHTHSTLTGTAGSTIAPSVGTGVMRYDYNVSSANAGTLPNANNANGVLTLNTHSGNYYSQLGFSSNGNFYYRAFNGAALDTTTAWKQVAFTNSSITGNAATATTLQTARTINGTSFNGSGNITTANWGTARNITIASSDGSGASAAVSVNGSANVALKLPATIKAALTGNATTATTLQTARTIALSGAVTGSASFNGSANITINTTENLNSNLTTITKSLNVTTSWIDTGITGTNLTTGTYAVQMIVNDGTKAGQYNEHYSGIMSWFADTTNSTDADEILLHKAGHASNGRHTYLRTIRSGSSGRLKLQISSTHAFTAASSITFKFKRLI